jgi:hypothetical protein
MEGGREGVVISIQRRRNAKVEGAAACAVRWRRGTRNRREEEEEEEEGGGGSGSWRRRPVGRSAAAPLIRPVIAAAGVIIGMGYANVTTNALGVAPG